MLLLLHFKVEEYAIRSDDKVGLLPAIIQELCELSERDGVDGAVANAQRRRRRNERLWMRRVRVDQRAARRQSSSPTQRDSAHVGTARQGERSKEPTCTREERRKKKKKRRSEGRIVEKTKIEQHSQGSSARRIKELDVQQRNVCEQNVFLLSTTALQVYGVQQAVLLALQRHDEALARRRTSWLSVRRVQ